MSCLNGHTVPRVDLRTVEYPALSSVSGITKLRMPTNYTFHSPSKFLLLRILSHGRLCFSNYAVARDIGNAILDTNAHEFPRHDGRSFRQSIRHTATQRSLHGMHCDLSVVARYVLTNLKNASALDQLALTISTARGFLFLVVPASPLLFVGRFRPRCLQSCRRLGSCDFRIRDGTAILSRKSSSVRQNQNRLQWCCNPIYWTSHSGITWLHRR